MKFKTSLLCLLAFMSVISCDDNTGSLGSSIIPPEDILEVIDSAQNIFSKSVIADNHILARSSDCFIGRHTDPETGVSTEADFLTQLNCTEDYEFPDSVYGLDQFHFSEKVKKQMEGVPSFFANIRLYFTDYTGDADNAIKIEVWPLSRTLDTQTRYYSDIDPTEFYDNKGKPLASASISPNDYAEKDSIRNKANSYLKNVVISLPDSVAENMLKAYYSEGGKAKFANTPAFIENICKGYYLRCVQGDGTILRINKVKLEVNFKHLLKDEQADTMKLVSSYAEFLGNSEVMQITRFKNNNLENLVADQNCTYLRTPYGINTELTLPIDALLGETGNIVNSASMVLKALRSSGDKYALSMPSSILLIRKSLVKDFFEKPNKADNISSYHTSLDTKFNEYTFQNISRLIMKCYNDRSEWLKAHNMENNETGRAAYEKEFPDWNKVMVIPVEPVGDSNNNVIYLNLDQTPKSVRLQGGINGQPIKVKIIRTDF